MIILVKELESRNTIVIGHDPIISEWEGSKPISIDSVCDLKVLAVHQPSSEIDNLISLSVSIHNCTNTFFTGDKINNF